MSDEQHAAPTGDVVMEALAKALSEPLPEEAATTLAIQQHLEELGRRSIPSAGAVFAMAKQGLQFETAAAIDQQVGENRVTYEHASREQLIDACCDRDYTIAMISRQLSEGKLGSTMLREFVRGVLHAADKGSPEMIQKLLDGLGAPTTDLRQLRIRGGTTL